mgnify:CR=1 FL=1|tara:strand:+ start:57 stop:545 length:489 start_codon:yes stop_codon:yes gene_type:complete
MNHYNNHLLRTTDATLVTKKKLERGMVVKMKYKKADGTITRYIVLVLHPKWPKGLGGMLHVLSMNEIPRIKAITLASNYDEIISEGSKVKRLDLAKLNIDMQARLFYSKEVSKIPLFKESYRTFKLSQIEQMHVVNYNWGKHDKIAPRVIRKRLDEDSENEN